MKMIPMSVSVGSSYFKRKPPMPTSFTWKRSVIAAAAVPMVLAGCSSPGEPAATTPTAPTAAAAEAAAVTPRLVISHDQGLQVLDAHTLTPVSDIDLPGFNRLNPAGDGRHVVVSTTGGFQILDAGTWAEPHGDHAHYYTADPALTQTTYPATKPGHVVVHEGRTALFDDGTGKVVVQDSAKIAAGPDGARFYTTPAAHHGVAVELADQRLVVSEGTEDARTGIRVLDRADQQVAGSDECPGVHGEAVAADETVVIGCENGALSATDLTSGGVVKHLAHMEDHWFTARVGAGELPEPWSSAPFESQPSWDFESAANDSVDEIADLYRTACDRSRSVTDRLPGLDSTAPRPSFGRGPVTLRWVMVHMLEETACHVGHLDLLTDPWSAE